MPLQDGLSPVEFNKNAEGVGGVKKLSSPAAAQRVTSSGVTAVTVESTTEAIERKLRIALRWMRWIAFACILFVIGTLLIAQNLQYYGVVNVALFPVLCAVDVLISIMEIRVLKVVASARRDKGGVTNSEMN